MMLRDDDDEIARILEGRDYTAASDPADDAVVAETVIRVRLDGHLGELELMIPHREGLAAAPDEESVEFFIPDAAYLEPTEHQKSCLTIRVRDLARVLDGMQRAVGRARALGVLPGAGS